MMKHYWTVMTKQSHIDQETNGIIIGEVIEEVQFRLPASLEAPFSGDVKKSGFVSLPFEFEIVTYLDAGTSDTKAAVSLDAVLPNGTIVPIANQTVDFGKNGRARYRFRSKALPVSGSGRQEFRLSESGGAKMALSVIPLFVTVEFAS